MEYFVESADGRTRQEWRKPEPDVAALRERILEVLAAEGKALVALNAAMYAADKSDRMGALRVRMRNEKATATIWSFAVMKALGVASNPLAVADVVGGTAVDAVMVVTLGKVYGIEITTANARELITSILKAAGWVMLSEAAVSYASSFFKAVTGGWGTVLTALPQGAAAGYGSYIVGQAARYYFEHGASWGEQGPEARRHADPGKHRQAIGAAAAQGGDQEEDLAESLRGEVDRQETRRRVRRGDLSSDVSLSPCSSHCRRASAKTQRSPPTAAQTRRRSTSSVRCKNRCLAMFCSIRPRCWCLKTGSPVRPVAGSTRSTVARRRQVSCCSSSGRPSAVRSRRRRTRATCGSVNRLQSARAPGSRSENQARGDDPLSCVPGRQLAFASARSRRANGAACAAAERRARAARASDLLTRLADFDGQRVAAVAGQQVFGHRRVQLAVAAIGDRLQTR